MKLFISSLYEQETIPPPTLLLTFDSTTVTMDDTNETWDTY